VVVRSSYSDVPSDKPDTAEERAPAVKATKPGIIEPDR